MFALTTLVKQFFDQVVKKLAGHTAGTCRWATNVGNEMGQILMCVSTSAEGELLRPMAQGLVARYRQAGVTPPCLLYTDRDCCGTIQIGMKLFPEWPQMQVLRVTLIFALRFYHALFLN